MLTQTLLCLPTAFLLLLTQNVVSEVHSHKSCNGIACFGRATTRRQMETLFKDNLQPDYEVFLAARPPGRLSAKQFQLLLKRALNERSPYPAKALYVVLVWGSACRTYPITPEEHTPVKRRVAALCAAINSTFASSNPPNAFSTSSRPTSPPFPSSLFLWNGGDFPWCPLGACAAPVMSHCKEWHPERSSSGGSNKAAGGFNGRNVKVHSSSPGGGDGGDRIAKLTVLGASRHEDILVPQFNHKTDDLVSTPWQDKRPRALLRAGIYQDMSANCSRIKLLDLARTKMGQALLDVGVYRNTHPHIRVPVVPAVNMSDHALFKYLLAADGNSASMRLDKLLLINSVTLKEESPWIMYYYRSLLSGRHYEPWTLPDLLPRLSSLEQQQHRALAISAAGQAFAYRYLSRASRLAYLDEAIRVYNRLFDDMQGLIQTALGHKNQVPHTTSELLRRLGVCNSTTCHSAALKHATHAPK